MGFTLLLERRQHLLHVSGLHLPVAGQKSPQVQVVVTVEEHGLRVFAVATRPTDFLVIFIKRFADVAVKDETDVRLVDAHAKGSRRHRTSYSSAIKAASVSLRARDAKAGVVVRRAQPRTGQQFRSSSACLRVAT